MDTLIQALLIITVPFDLIILCAGTYFIKAYTTEQGIIREQLHDAEITQREQIRYNAALVKSGQAPNGGTDFIGQLIGAVGPQLLSKLVPTSQSDASPLTVQEGVNNGKA